MECPECDGTGRCQNEFHATNLVAAIVDSVEGLLGFEDTCPACGKQVSTPGNCSACGGTGRQ